MTGIFDANTALASVSSLNATKSSAEPPPRPMMMTSAAFWAFINFTAAVSCAAASSPCTSTGQNTISAAGQRRESMLRISCTAAPVGDVMTPMRAGNGGIGRLCSSANSPSAASFSFSCSNAKLSAPTPSGCISST